MRGFSRMSEANETKNYKYSYNIPTARACVRACACARGHACVRVRVRERFKILKICGTIC